jgi:hypothetical protein
MIKTKRRNLLKLAGNLFCGWLIFSPVPKKKKQKLTSTERVRSQKYDPAYHRRLEKEFPDWPERIAYQEKQKRLYDSAMRKEREASKLRLRNKQFAWTLEEKDALDYIKGTGPYAYYQDPSTPPNIFDRRQTFLLKMHDLTAQEKFLNSFNRQNN